jgi:hypothetical protein
MEVASPDGPQVRVSLLDDHGRPLKGLTRVDNVSEEWAASDIAPALPPASEALSQRLEDGDATVTDLLLAAQLARGRNDPEGEYKWIERARAGDPDDSWAALALARHLFTETGGLSGADRARNITQLLREASAIPGSQLFERAIAMREGRSEDAERILDQLMAGHPDDSRVLRVWIRETVRRGWVREAEEGLAQLEAELPGSLSVTDLRLDVLASLERWQERGVLLRALAAATPVETRWIGQMASSCLIGEAVASTVSLLPKIDDPDLDVQLVQLLLENGDFETARNELGRARGRWGELRVFDELGLLLAGDDREAMDTALAGALERDPSNLQLLALSWRNGREAFFAPFAVDSRDFIGEHRDLGSDVDAVLLLDQAVERIFADGSSLYYYHGLTRANTPVGARRASMLQPLPDAYLLKIRILKPDGRVVVPSDLQPGQGGVVLSDVEAGDVVEEEYVAWVGPTGASRDGHLPPYIYRFADPDRAFGLSEYVLLVPPEINLQVDGNFEGLERSEKEWQGLRMLYWRAEKVPPMPAEPFAPPAQDLMPWLNYGFGVSWQDVGDAVRDRVLAVLRSSPELREWSRTVLVGETPEEQFRSLVHALIETVESGGVTSRWGKPPVKASTAVEATVSVSLPPCSRRPDGVSISFSPAPGPTATNVSRYRPLTRSRWLCCDWHTPATKSGSTAVRKVGASTTFTPSSREVTDSFCPSRPPANRWPESKHCRRFPTRTWSRSSPCVRSSIRRASRESPSPCLSGVARPVACSKRWRPFRRTRSEWYTARWRSPSSRARIRSTVRSRRLKRAPRSTLTSLFPVRAMPKTMNSCVAV